MASWTRQMIGLAVVPFLLFAFVARPASGWAAGAADELRPTIDEVLKILANRELKGEAHVRERRAALQAVMEDAIDFREAARRALSVHWRARTDREREEFVALFKDLVTYSYIRVIELYAGETVQIVGEFQTEGATTVLTRIHPRQGEPVPLDYRMHRLGGRWLIYDVVLQGVSLVTNYREQFNTIIQTTSYKELVRRIRARGHELNQTPAAAGRIPAPRG